MDKTTTPKAPSLSSRCALLSGCFKAGRLDLPASSGTSPTLGIITPLSTYNPNRRVPYESTSRYLQYAIAEWLSLRHSQR